MEIQNYKNHVRFYIPHHFVFYPLALLMVAFCVWRGFKSPEQSTIWWFQAGLVSLTVFIAFMMRQHYALTSQNRIVRLEMRFRYYVLTHSRFEEIEYRLTNSQIFALRFASDAELPGLVKRTLEEKLSADEIKKAIVNWLPDNMRV